MTRQTGFGGCWTFLLGFTIFTPAFADFTFTKIADTADGFTNLTPPAINPGGIVVFTAARDEQTGIYQSNGGAMPFRLPVAAMTFKNASISNNAEYVAFTASRPGESDSGIYRLSGGTVTPIIEATGAATYFRGVVDDAGNVAFNGREFLIGGSVAGVGNGGRVSYIVRSPGGIRVTDPPAMNPSGDTATYFSTQSNSEFIRFNSNDVVRFDTLNLANSTMFSRPAIPSQPPVPMLISEFSRPDVNGADQIVFFANWGAISDLLLRWENGFLAELGEFSGGISRSSIPAINDEGVVAALVRSATDPNAESLRVGLDAPTETILSIGSPFMGSAVTDLDFVPEGLADSGGHLAFWAALADGRQGVYTVQIVPEPGSVALMGLIAAPLLWKRRR